MMERLTLYYRYYKKNKVKITDAANCNDRGSGVGGRSGTIGYEGWNGSCVSIRSDPCPSVLMSTPLLAALLFARASQIEKSFTGIDNLHRHLCRPLAREHHPAKDRTHPVTPGNRICCHAGNNQPRIDLF